MENGKENETVVPLPDNVIKQVVNKVWKETCHKIESGKLPKIPVEIKAKGASFLEDCLSKEEKKIRLLVPDEIFKGFAKAIELVKKHKRLRWTEKARTILESLAPLCTDMRLQKRNERSISIINNIDIDLHEVNPDILKRYQKLLTLPKTARKRILQYRIELGRESREFGIISTIEEIIAVSNEKFFDPLLSANKNNPVEIKTAWSIADLYPYWLSTLDLKKLKSNDLLDHLMVTFTIKRAALGDKEAIEKLHSLFAKIAISIAWMMARQRQLKINRELAKDIKQEARVILETLLSGFRAEYYISSLLDGKKPGYYQNWIAKRIVLYYCNVIFPQLLGMQITLKDLAPLRALENSSVISEMNPDHVRKLFRSYESNPLNSFVFRPDGKTPLYVWLFGVKSWPCKGVTRGFMQGKFCQFFDEFLQSKFNEGKNIAYDFSMEVDEDEAVEGTITRRKVSKKTVTGMPGHRMIDYEHIERAKEKLIADGISGRDAEIYLKNNIEGISKVQLSKEYKRSRVTIHKICKKLDKRYKSK